MTASGEVRLVPVSRDQRDALAADYLPPEPRALVAAWDAAAPGVVDSSWAGVEYPLRRALFYLNGGGSWEDKISLVYPLVEHAHRIARAAAGGEAAAAGVRLTHGRHCTCSACAREDWTNPDLAPCGMHGPSCPREYQPIGNAFDEPAGGEAAVERSLPSRADAVWTVDDLPHLLDEPVERPSVSLRETSTYATCAAALRAAGWSTSDGGRSWSHPRVYNGAGMALYSAISEQVEREAGEGERDDG